MINADRVLLRRAVDNLLDNARRYSDAGTTIRLSARQREGGLRIAVSDEGVGIDPLDVEHVFSPFFRGERSRSRATGGAGIGLTLVRKVVAAHGGTVGIESAPGDGTTVNLDLPCLRLVSPESPEG